MILNLGSGNNPMCGALNVDHKRGVHVDLVADAEHLPFHDGSVDCVFASHFLEHARDLPATLSEIHRVLRDGGGLSTVVPYGLASLYNPYHTRAFNMTTLKVLTDPSTDLDVLSTRWELREAHVNRTIYFVKRKLVVVRELRFVLAAVKDAH